MGFSEWTQAGHVRHPKFKGVRRDKPAKEIVREKAKELTASSGRGG